MPTVEIICLANSWKRGGRCVAGLRTDGGGWIRPVSVEPEGALCSDHYTMARGRKAALLDVLKVRLLEPQPSPHQPENWLIDTGRWKRCKSSSSQDVMDFLAQHLNAGPELFGDIKEKIAYASFQRKPASGSLALVKPEILSWQLGKNPKTGRQQVRAIFALAGTTYNLPLTDPIHQERLAALPDGYHAWEKSGQETLLTISLGEPFGRSKDCYKLVAGVITLPLSDLQKKSEDKGKLWSIIWDWTLERAGRRRF